MTILRCPKCKGKVLYTKLRKEYWCWECENYYKPMELIIFNNYITQRKGIDFNSR